MTVKLRPFDYDAYAPLYDLLEYKGEAETEGLNDFLHKTFIHAGVKTVLDLSCGTGAQAIGLAKRGYSVPASDPSDGFSLILQETKSRLCGDPAR